jgi:alcohol dehydrogenase
MEAMVLYQHGANENITYERNYRDPVASEGDVVVRVKSCSLNYHDIFTRRGMPGIKIPLPIIMGLDVAGEIAEVGPGVEGWKVGERVLIDPVNRIEGGLTGETLNGGLAELCKTRAHQLIRIPQGVSYTDAASLPTAYGTAMRMMAKADIKPGQRVLILGASGGVGVCCVALAKMAGAEVIACAGTDDKADRLSKLGADHVVNYRQTDFQEWIYEKFGKPKVRRGADGGVDVVVNYTGGDTWMKSMRCIKRGGSLLVCGATAGFDVSQDLRFLWSYEVAVRGSNGWLKSDLLKLLEMVQTGKLKTVIDHQFPLEKTRDAFALIEDRRVFGKVVVNP